MSDLSPEAYPRAAGEDDSPPNARAVLRVANDFLLRGLDAMARQAGDDLILALVFNAIETANLRRITQGPTIEYGGIDQVPPDAVRMPASILAIANSLRIPYETVRRSVHVLLGRGLCRRVNHRGYIVPAAVDERPQEREALAQGYASLLRLLADLKRAGFDFEPYRRILPETVAPVPCGALPSNVRACARFAAEIVMRGIDTLGRIHGDDFLTALVFTAIWTANVQHITASQDNLTFGGLRDLPPDAARRPVTVSAVAAALRIPYETVRRCVARLTREGSALRIARKGVIIPRARLANAAGFDTVRSSYVNVARLVGQLHRAGFDFSGY